MKTFKQPYFILFSAIFAVVFTAQRLSYPLPSWINNYVSDFLCMPIVLTICLACVRYIKKDNSLQLSLTVILSLAAYYSVYFEYYLPQHNPRYTADPVDVIIYFLGALLFYYLRQREVKGGQSLRGGS